MFVVMWRVENWLPSTGWVLSIDLPDARLASRMEALMHAKERATNAWISARRAATSTELDTGSTTIELEALPTAYKVRTIKRNESGAHMAALTTYYVLDEDEPESEEWLPPTPLLPF